MLARDEDILKAAEEWRKSGRDVALATVVETWGSAPRPVGSNLVIDNEGNFLGSVSGGCVEGAVVAEAMDVIDSGKPKILEFGVADETAWKVGLSCGGTIRVYVEKVSLSETRRSARTQRRACGASCRGAGHRYGERCAAPGEGCARKERRSEGCAGKTVAHGQERYGGHSPGAGLPDCLCSIAKACHNRSRAHQSGAWRPLLNCLAMM